jgi:diphthamide synthase subunit DPH2
MMTTYIAADDNVSNIFKRRLALIARARNCRVFGIVVNAIATVGILDAIERCETVSILLETATFSERGQVI